MTSWEIRSLQDCPSSDWAGGRTTELFCYPPTSSYQERTFNFRLSRATVQADRSPFTSLPGYKRILVSLDRAIELTDQQTGQAISLKPLEPYAFLGEQTIHSRGQCQDFNLIYKPDYKGQLEMLAADSSPLSGAPWQFLYALQDLEVQLDRQQFLSLRSQELLILRDMDQQTSLQLVAQAPKQEKLAIWVGLTPPPSTH